MAHPAGSAARNIIKGSDAVIASRENRWLKRFRAALAGEPGEDEAVGVEGVRLVEAAVGSGLQVDALLVSESGARHLSRLARLTRGASAASPTASDVPLLRTSDKLFSSVTDTRAPQGIAALVRLRHAAITNLLQGTPLLVILAGVQDPGNVGTAIRAAEAFGATGAATCAAGGIGTANPFAPKAMRASAGSALRLPIVHGLPAATLFGELRRARVKVYAAVAAEAGAQENSKNKISANTDGLTLAWDIDWNISAAILIGNEGAGLPADLVTAADARVYIPQAAATAAVGIESLNAAMAASVLLYEAMRQRNAAQRGQS